MTARNLIQALLAIEDQSKDIVFWSQDAFEFIDAVTETTDYLVLYPLQPAMTVTSADEPEDLPDYLAELQQLANYHLEDYRRQERAGTLQPDQGALAYWKSLINNKKGGSTCTPRT